MPDAYGDNWLLYNVDANTARKVESRGGKNFSTLGRTHTQILPTADCLLAIPYCISITGPL